MVDSSSQDSNACINQNSAEQRGRPSEILMNYLSASLSSLVLHPVNSCQPAPSDSQLHLLNLRGLPGFILPSWWPLQAVWAVVVFICVFCPLGSHHYLISNALKTFLSYILSSFVAVSGRKLNLVFISPSLMRV